MSPQEEAAIVNAYYMDGVAGTKLAKQYKVPIHYIYALLRRHGTPRTHGATKTHNLCGRRFGRLTVIAESTVRAYHVIVRCDCGQERDVRKSSLVQGTTQSCGCLIPDAAIRRRKAPKEAAYTTLYKRYTKGAKHRNLCFELSLEVFKKLINEACHYCGDAPYQKFNPYATKDGTPIGNAVQDWIDANWIVYNGLDRVDNALGYYEDNVVTACPICNQAKHTLTYSEFIAWVDKLVNRRSLWKRKA